MLEVPRRERGPRYQGVPLPRATHQWASRLLRVVLLWVGPGPQPARGAVEPVGRVGP